MPTQNNPVFTIFRIYHFQGMQLNYYASRLCIPISLLLISQHVGIPWAIKGLVKRDTLFSASTAHVGQGYSLNQLHEVVDSLHKENVGKRYFKPEKMWFDCKALFSHLQTRSIRDPYEDELYTILSLMACGYHGVFLRYGDGELALIKGQSIGGGSQALVVDHFSWNKPYQGALGARLEETLRMTSESILYAISCTKCPVSINNEIAPYIQQRPGMWSYSVLFHNTNYNAFAAWLTLISSGRREALGGRPLVLVVNEEVRQRNVTWVDDVLYFPDDCVNAYEEHGDRMLEPLLNAARARDNSVFLLSGGPLAKWAAYAMSQVNPRNFYVDVGSSIDFLVKGRITRPFHTQPGEHRCAQK